MPVPLLTKSISVIALTGFMLLIASIDIASLVQNTSSEVQKPPEAALSSTAPAHSGNVQAIKSGGILGQAPELVGAAPRRDPSASDTPAHPELKPIMEAASASPPLSSIRKQLPLDIIEAKTRSTVVHLTCTSKGEQALRATSGSGVIIDSRGVVLTNAHVAQFWLLPEKNPLGGTECNVRTSVPIEQRYHADLLYLPPAWIRKHAKDIARENPTGTGEHDYALLLITKTTDGSPLPAAFPAASVDVSERSVTKGEAIIIAAYPARKTAKSVEYFDTLQLSSIRATIQKLFTFDKTTLDLFSVSGNILSFQGSSGSPVVNEDNRVVGIISTSTDGESFLDRSLRAITTAHINRSLKAQTGLDLAFWIASDVETKAALFANSTAIELGEQLVSELENRAQP